MLPLSTLALLSVLPYIVTSTADVPGTKASWCAAFKPAVTSLVSTVFIDKFSPDDVACTDSKRYVDLAETRATDYEFHISASGTGDDCYETWGRRFDQTDPIDPILEELATPEYITSFKSKVPETDPLYPYAQDGALDFTVVSGYVNNTHVLMFNGLYNGKGGPMPNNETAPPAACDNFWMNVDDL